MKLISRLFIKEWFKALIGSISALLLLITTADIINAFLMGRDGARAILEWSFKMPDLTGKMLPVTCLLATLFSLNKLKSHNELIAALAAGFSYGRMTSIIATCSLSVVFLQFSNLGFIEPYANSVKRSEIQKSRISEGKYLTRSVVDGGQFWFKSQNYFGTFSTFNKSDNSLSNLQLYYFNDEGLLSHQLTSERALFRDDEWVLENAKKIDQLLGSKFPLIESQKSIRIKLNETPSDFNEFEADLTTLNWFNLKLFIDKISHTGINTNEYFIMLHQKLALSLSCLVFALIPLGSLYRPNRRSDSFGMNVAFTLILTVAFWLLFSSSVSFGQSGKIPAWIAVYLIPVIFLSHALWTFARHRKLTF